MIGRGNNVWAIALTGACAGAWASVAFVPGPYETVRSLCFTIPLGILAAFPVFGLLVRHLSRAGLTPDETRRAAAEAIAPLRLLCLAPLAVQARGVALILGVLAIGLTFCRLAEMPGRQWNEQAAGRRERWIFGSLFVAMLVTFFQANIVHDAFQYYGYLVSMFLHGDLNLYDQVFIHNTHRFYNPFPMQSARYMGTEVMEAPFFAAGHVIVLVLNKLGLFCPQNGNSMPYVLATSLASPLFGFAGLIACYFTLRSFFSRAVSLIAVAGIWIASPLLFFMFCWNGWSHPFGFFFVSLFLLCWQRTRSGRTTSQWLLLGALGGLACLVRVTNGVVFLLPLLEAAGRLFARQPGAWRRPAGLAAGLALLGIAALVMFSPQFSLWKAISGQWIGAPYSEVGDYSSWLKPAIGGLLFSVEQHGLFAWTPLLLPATLGLLFMWKRDRLLALASVIALAGTAYVYACWSIWWSGIGFSNRFLIEMSPFFMFGLACLVDAARKRALGEWAAGLVLVASAWNVLLVGAYRISIVPMGIADPFRVVDRPLTAGALVHAVLVEFPGQLGSLFDGIWINQNYFAGRLKDSFVFANPGEFVQVTCVLAMTVVAALVVQKIMFALAGKGAGRGLRVAALVLLSAGILLLHAAIGNASANTAKPGVSRRSPDLAGSQGTKPVRFHHFDEIDQQINAGGEPIYYYCDYPLPVTRMDFLSYLTYAHALPEGAPVAEIILTGRDGEQWTNTLYCGHDTVESSILRPESREVMRHGPEGADIVRSVPTHMYSQSWYEFVTCRSALTLPAPMVVRRVEVRYLPRFGRLVVADVFVRDF